MLVNPAARAGTGGTIATRAAERLREHGIRATLISGGSAVESTELLREAVRLGTDAVAVAGGDGTVSLAMQVLAHSTTPLGIIPAGTGNDLADMLGIRELHPDEAADAIVGGLTRDIDLARISRHGEPEVYFGSVLASGFDSRVNDRANRMRWPRGSSRYTIAILRELVGLRSFAYEIELTDAAGSVTRHDGALLMAAVANGTSYGGGVQIAPRADPADGELDVVLVRPTHRARFLRLLPRVYRGTHGAVPEVSMYRARMIRLSAPGVTAYADGDPIGPLPVQIDVVPRALRVFVPAN